MLNEISEYCKALRLSKNIVENCKTTEAESYEEFLMKILKSEVEHRKEARTNLLLKRAGFNKLKTFRDYDFKEITLPESLNLNDLKELSFLDNKENLIMYGNVGTGKTHLATALGVEACMNGKKVGFYTTAGLVNQLSESKSNGKLTSLLKKLKNLDLLICDEWGYVPLSREGSQLLFEVISDSYEKRSLIITTNLEFSKWANVFYDEKMTAAMLDRLVHYSHLLLFEGQSYRLKNALMK